MKKIKFLLLHLGYGGIETATINIANVLSNYYSVELVSLYDVKTNQEFKIKTSVKIKKLYNGEPNRDQFKNALKNKNLCKIIQEGLKAIKILFLKKYLIIKEILENDCDIIVSTRMEFSILLNKFGAKNTLKIAQEHCYHNNEKKYINNLKHKYKKLDYLFALTTSLARDYRKFLKKNKHTKVVIVPNMIEHYPDKISDLNNKNVITVGRLHKGKRINELVNIFSKLKSKKSKLYIIGDGEEYKSIKKQVTDLKLEKRVIMLGYLTIFEIKSYMLDSCVFAMTSNTEGLPMVLIEAMSYGIPCIAYEVESGINDIIKKDTGYIVKNRNEKKYILKLDELISNQKVKKKFGKQAYANSLRFSSDNIIRIWKKYLDY